MKLFYQHLLSLYKDNGIIGLCYLASSKMPKLDGFIKKPILYVYGNKASGKTEFVKFIFRNKFLDYYINNRTVLEFKSLLRNNHYPFILFDDINKPLDPFVRECIKSGYDDVTTDCQFIVSGQADLSKDVSLFTRMIFLDFSRMAGFSKDEKDGFRKLSFIREFALLSHYDFSESNFKAIKSLITADRIIESTFSSVESRLKENYRSLLAGYYYFADLFQCNEKMVVDIILRHLERQQLLISEPQIHSSENKEVFDIVKRNIAEL